MNEETIIVRSGKPGTGTTFGKFHHQNKDGFQRARAMCSISQAKRPGMRQAKAIRSFCMEFSRSLDLSLLLSLHQGKESKCRIKKLPTGAFFLTFLLAVLVTKSQDVHFSQFGEAPLVFNPALTGMGQGSFRACLNYRDQWKSISTPYRTFAASCDMGFRRAKKNGYLGLGLMAFKDMAGDVQMGNTLLNVSLSGVVNLDRNNRVSAGIQGGAGQRNIDPDKMEWDAQFNGKYFDKGSSTGEKALYRSSFYYGDFNAGLAWSFYKNNTNMSSNDHFGVSAGAGLFHINRPRYLLGAEGIDGLEKLYSKLVAHGEMDIGLRHVNASIVPQFLFLRQGPAQEISAGAMIRYVIKEKSVYTGIKPASVLLGGHVRVGDAFIPSVAMEYNDLRVGVSYDVNYSPLNLASNGKGGIEISLRHDFMSNQGAYKRGKGSGGMMFR